MKKWFGSLNDAVEVAHREFGVDKVLARQEFFQKCYISDDQYGIGYYDGVVDAEKAAHKLIEDK